MSELWKHQRAGVEFLKQKDGGMLFFEMRLGKTRTAVTWAAESKLNHVLVICPKHANEVWIDEIANYDGQSLGFLDATQGTINERAQMLPDFMNRFTTNSFVVNYGAFNKGVLWDAIKRVSWDAIIVDEAHRIGAAGSDQSKDLYQLGKRVPYRIALTGTPGTPLKVYGIARFVDDKLFGTNFAKFESRYSDFYTPSGARYHVGHVYKNLDEYTKILSTKAMSVKAKDVFELPDCMHLIRHFDLNKKAQKFYKELKKEMIAEWDNYTMTVSNVLVKSLRLHQLTGGFINDELVDNGKLDLLEDVIDEIDVVEPLVIFARYTNEIKAIKAKLKNSHRIVCELSGSVNELAKWRSISGELYGPVLVVQIDTGAEAIDLTKSAYAIYYSHHFSSLKYQQSVARIGGPKQTRKSAIIHLLTKNSIDEVIYDSLINNKKLEDQILEAIGIKNNDI